MKNNQMLKIIKASLSKRRQKTIAKLCSIYKDSNYNHKTKLSFADFKNLPGENEIVKDLKDSENLSSSIKKRPQ